jgi:hypothetical protein
LARVELLPFPVDYFCAFGNREMAITDGSALQRGQWHYVGIGMLIVISIFMLDDAIGRIIHHRDFGWFVAFGGATTLIVWISKVARKK